MSSSKDIEQILNESPDLWRAGSLSASKSHTIKTGYDSLDDILPGNGWPTSALMEFIVPSWGIGEISLLMPLLKFMSDKSYWIVWLAPPHIPYTPYLQAQGIDLSRVLVISDKVSSVECLWAMEKLLRTDNCGLVMSWSQKINQNAMRRLQLAAEAGKSIGVVFQIKEKKNSAAAFRFRLKAMQAGLNIEVIKSRGGSRHRQVIVQWDEPVLSPGFTRAT